MKISKQEFINSPKKSITLIGMSGAGKSYISRQLEKWGWHNYSCDYEIGVKYLKDELEGAFCAQNISSLSEYLGRVGEYSFDEFKARQLAYYNAEINALADMEAELRSTNKDFVHDSTGSLVEIQDEELIKKIGEQTLFVYLKTDEKSEQQVLQRAFDYPKPLFFPPAFLSEKIDQYLSENNLNSVEEVITDKFSRWVFPLLFNSRKPKYQRLADLYGVTIPALEFAELNSADEFIDIIGKHL